MDRIRWKEVLAVTLVVVVITPACGEITESDMSYEYEGKAEKGEAGEENYFLQNFLSGCIDYCESIGGVCDYSGSENRYDEMGISNNKAWIFGCWEKNGENTRKSVDQIAVLLNEALSLCIDYCSNEGAVCRFHDQTVSSKNRDVIEQSWVWNFNCGPEGAANTSCTKNKDCLADHLCFDMDDPSDQTGMVSPDHVGVCIATDALPYQEDSEY